MIELSNQLNQWFLTEGGGANHGVRGRGEIVDLLTNFDIFTVLLCLE